MKLQKQIALITGAGQGIGKGVAEVFAEEGADVAVNDKVLTPQLDQVAGWVRQTGRRAVAVAADVASRDEVEAMFDSVWESLGPIDVLVNNAGVESIVPFLDLTDEEWNRVTEVNLRGEWLCSQVFCRRLVAEKRKGCIINIGSIQASKALCGRTHYAPSKLAVEALTRNLSLEMGALGIRVNCIHPGLIETSMTDWVMKQPDLLAKVTSEISLGRAGQPREIGTVAAFFASDEARYVTGQCLFVDGGWVGK